MARNEVHSIEITFPTGVDVTDEDQQMLVTLADEICTRWENERALGILQTNAQIFVDRAGSLQGGSRLLNFAC